MSEASVKYGALTVLQMHVRYGVRYTADSNDDEAACSGLLTAHFTQISSSLNGAEVRTVNVTDVWW